LHWKEETPWLAQMRKYDYLSKQQYDSFKNDHHPS